MIRYIMMILMVSFPFTTAASLSEITINGEDDIPNLVSGDDTLSFRFSVDSPDIPKSDIEVKRTVNGRESNLRNFVCFTEGESTVCQGSERVSANEDSFGGNNFIEVEVDSVDSSRNAVVADGIGFFDIDAESPDIGNVNVELGEGKIFLTGASIKDSVNLESVEVTINGERKYFNEVNEKTFDVDEIEFDYSGEFEVSLILTATDILGHTTNKGLLTGILDNVAPVINSVQFKQGEFFGVESNNNYKPVLLVDVTEGNSFNVDVSGDISGSDICDPVEPCEIEVSLISGIKTEISFNVKITEDISGGVEVDQDFTVVLPVDREAPVVESFKLDQEGSNEIFYYVTGQAYNFTIEVNDELTKVDENSLRVDGGSISELSLNDESNIQGKILFDSGNLQEVSITTLKDILGNNINEAYTMNLIHDNTKPDFEGDISLKQINSQGTFPISSSLAGGENFIVVFQVNELNPFKIEVNTEGITAENVHEFTDESCEVKSSDGDNLISECQLQVPQNAINPESVLSKEIKVKVIDRAGNFKENSINVNVKPSVEIDNLDVAVPEDLDEDDLLVDVDLLNYIDLRHPIQQKFSLDDGYTILSADVDCRGLDNVVTNLNDDGDSVTTTFLFPKGEYLTFDEILCGYTLSFSREDAIIKNTQLVEVPYQFETAVTSSASSLDDEIQEKMYNMLEEINVQNENLLNIAKAINILRFGCSIFQLINLGAVIMDLVGVQLEVASTVTAGLAKPVEQGQCVAANGLKIAGDGFFYFLRRGCAALSCTQPFLDLPAELSSKLDVFGFGEQGSSIQQNPRVLQATGGDTQTSSRSISLGQNVPPNTFIGGVARQCIPDIINAGIKLQVAGKCEQYNCYKNSVSAGLASTEYCDKVGEYDSCAEFDALYLTAMNLFGLGPILQWLNIVIETFKNPVYGVLIGTYAYHCTISCGISKSAETACTYIAVAGQGYEMAMNIYNMYQQGFNFEIPECQQAVTDWETLQSSEFVQSNQGLVENQI